MRYISRIGSRELYPKYTQLYTRYYVGCNVIVRHYTKNSSRYNFNSESVINDTVTADVNSEQNTNKDFRVNDLHIQMLSKCLYHQLFGNENSKTKNKELIDGCLSELKKHGLPGPLQKVPDVNIQLPALHNNNIEDHFYKIGEEQSVPYRNLINELVQFIPSMPTEWVFSTGWTKYTGDSVTSVEYPDERAMLLDVEVCVKEGEMPTIATAVSPSAWYSWVSKDLAERHSCIRKYSYSLDRLIPLETSYKVTGKRLGDSFLKPKVVVGHGVSYDRARVREQYWLDRTGLRFVDTMSLHVCVSGVTSYQKLMLKSGNIGDDDWSALSSLNSLKEVYKLYCGGEIEKEKRNVFIMGTYNDVTQDFQSLMTYCANDVLATHYVLTKLWPMFLDRFPHPVTFAGMLELGTCYLPVNQNWKRYIEDAQQSYNDLDIEVKYLLSREADKACQLLHDENYKRDLWLWDQDWKVKDLKLKKDKPPPKKRNQDKPLPDAALLEEEPDKLNSTTSTDDIDEYEAKTQKLLIEKFSDLSKTKERLPKVIPHLAGYPEWYRKLCPSIKDPDWKPGPQLISTSMQITPKLLNLTWKSMPLHFIRGSGWGQLVPFSTDIALPEDEISIVPLQKLKEHYVAVFDDFDSLLEGNIDMLNEDIHQIVENDCSMKFLNKMRKFPKKEDILDKIQCSNVCGLIKLPHKNGVHLNVGNPLARDYINKFSEAGLGGSEKTGRLIEISRQLSYWKNNRERIEGQVIVWLGRNELPSSVVADADCCCYGVILPQVIVCGTLTRRAVERTWMTASNAIDERVGSELRSMVQAPRGYCLVGADVDSQELWIASLIGDAYHAKEHGCTAFGWMTLSGQKSDGTDMHSVTAKTMGISRNHAKVINYARIYGAGQPFAERLLKQFVPGISDIDSRNKAMKMFRTTKGRRMFTLKEGCLPEVEKRTYIRAEAKELCEINGKSVGELFDRPKWANGSESSMFNRLEDIAYSAEPVTPFLRCRLSRALEPSSYTEDKYIPTRINWVVQSGAVDFLHLMLVCMRWLVDSRVRFCLSFHDEVRYIVPEKLKYQTALALHVTNLLTRAFCVKRLGMTDLPQSVAFFTSVEVDTVLRKEATHDCKTPSNPHGLSKGYNIPLGESLDIFQAIEKSGGIIGTLKNYKKTVKVRGK